jgi:hypothetical protein
MSEGPQQGRILAGRGKTPIFAGLANLLRYGWRCGVTP